MNIVDLIRKFIINITKLILKIFFRLEVEGLDKIPKEGPLIVISNHHSYLDPMVLTVSFPRKIHFIAKKELFYHPLTFFFVRLYDSIPIDRKNVQISSFKKVFRYLEENKVIGIFPEGTRVKNPSEFGKSKEGINFILTYKKLPVLITYIDGTYQWYKKFKIKVKFKRVIFPDDLSQVDKSEVGNFLMEEVYKWS